MLAQPVSVASSSISPSAPTSDSTPLTTGRRRARYAIRATTTTNATVTSASTPISVQGIAEAGNVGVDQHQRADDERNDAADAERAVGGHEHLGDDERDAERHQRESGVVDRQQMQRVEPEQQRHGAGDAGQHETGIAELEDEAVDADAASGSSRRSDR